MDMAERIGPVWPCSGGNLCSEHGLAGTAASGGVVKATSW